MRGLAALFVVCAHYLQNFWFRQKSVAGYIHATPLENIDPPMITEIFNQIPILSFGEFGVALFFLISGFLIPLSLERYGVLPFLISRFFRIWPLYLVGFCCTLGVFYLISVHQGKSFPFSVSQVLVQSAIFLRDWLHFPNIDGIVWTLEIEIKFYLFMAVWFYLLQIIDFRKITFFMVLLCAVLIILPLFRAFLFYNLRSVYSILSVLSFNVAIISYMLCGMIFYMILMERVSVQKSIIYFAILLSCFAGTWSFGLFVSNRYAIPQYFLAFAAFAICFMLKDYFRPSRFLDWLANISYPLYVTHAAAGYSLMYVLVSYGWPESVTLLTAFLLAFAIATFLHYLIERPTHLLGQSLARSFSIKKSDPKKKLTS